MDAAALPREELRLEILYYAACVEAQQPTLPPRGRAVGESGELRLTVRGAEDLLVRIEKAPDGRVVLPDLEDFEVVNRSRDPQSGSIAWFLDRALRNLESARKARGFDFSALAAGAVDRRDQAIREQMRQLQALRNLERGFVVALEDASGLSKLVPPSEAVVQAHIQAFTREFPECAAVPERVLPSLDVDGLAAFILDRRPRTIVLLGAGASTSAGIPDFRSPGTGLYDNLLAYDLPYPTAVFDIQYFRERPEPFFRLARELWPGAHSPTPTHRLVRLLHKEGLLLRCYTQNIDGLEALAGVPPELLVEAHGHFRTAHGVETGKEVPVEAVRAAVFGGGPDKLRAEVGELAKPDIVFFGEPLPQRFADLAGVDFPACELLVVAGTSLKVAPFNELVGCVPAACPRVLMNREPAGLEARSEAEVRRGKLRHGFRFGEEAAGRNVRDVFLEGACDDAASALAGALGYSLW